MDYRLDSLEEPEEEPQEQILKLFQGVENDDEPVGWELDLPQP